MAFTRPVPKPRICSKEIGERAEAIIIAKLLGCNYTVLVPFGDSQHYDIVIEDGNRQFWRIQCKTGRYKQGSISFPCSHVPGGGRRDYSRVGYEGLADYFAVYSKDFNAVYLVPVGDVGTNQALLRVDPLKRDERYMPKSTRWAKDYEL